MTPQMSRRRFLKTGCIAAAAVGVTVCGGVGLASTYQPAVDLPAVSYGDKSAARILLTYASKAGSTGETAARMGEMLSKAGLFVDVLSVGQVSDLAPYKAVVLGSAIRAGSVLPEATAFIEKNQAALTQRHFSVFILCLTLKEDTAENRTKVAAYLDPVRKLIRPASEGLFAGVMNPDKLTLLERVMMLFMNAPAGDYRKWDLITAWTKRLPTTWS